MKLSYYLPTGTTHEFAGFTDPVAAFAKLPELAKAADEAGFATIWAPDHFVPFGPAGSYVFEAWTTPAAVARETRTARLGQLVTGNGYRNPALLAKMAANLDVVSGGRLTFGIGAGWYEFPGAGERLRRLEEALRIITALWTGDPATFTGRGLVGTPDTIRKRLAVYREAGVDELIVAFHDGLDLGTLRTFADEFVAP